MAKYPKYTQEKGGWTIWIQPKMRLYKMACCDCGLVHNMQFRIKNGRVQFRASRNERSTGQMRRKSKNTIGDEKPN